MGARQQFIAFMTILIKEIRRFTRIWGQTLLPPAITMALYFVIFGNLIGPRIGQIHGVDYIRFMVPGLIMMAVITNSYSNVVSSFFGAKFQHSIEELLVSPVPNHLILLGYVLGGVARGLCVGAIVTVLALGFSAIQVQHVGITVLMVLLTAVLFATLGFINAVYANTFDDISIVPTFVLTPLIYLGGVFYSIEMLPEFWRGVSMVNPMLYMVNAFRYGLLGVSDVPVWISIVMVAGCCLAAFGFALYLLNAGKRLRH